MNKEIDRIRSEYDELETDIMHIMEEKNRRIKEKIDKQLKEHKKQMEMIIELLSRKERKKI